MHHRNPNERLGGKMAGKLARLRLSNTKNVHKEKNTGGKDGRGFLLTSGISIRGKKCST